MKPRPLTLLLIFLALAGMDLKAQDSTTRPEPTIQDTAKPKPRPKPPVAPVPVQDSVRKDSVTVPAKPIDTISVSKRMIPLEQLFPMEEKFPTVYGAYVGGYMKQGGRFNTTGQVKSVPVLERTQESRDWIFYFFCSLLLVVAFVNIAFSKYFVDLFRVFFNTSLRQKQLREQLSQTPLPSLLLNLVFCISGGAFVFFLLKQYNIHTGYHPAVEMLLAIGAIAGIYIVKFVFVNMLGWMFDRRHAAENYVFTVFLVNKVAGLVLIPITILLAYAAPGKGGAILTVGIMLLTVLLFMRLTKGFLSINALRINVIQFLVFVGAFEVVPALLIYKVLLRVFV